jgi:hypothetical protein
MKLLNILVSVLALSHSASGGRVIVGSDNKTWSPATKVPSECEKHIDDFIHVHKNDLDSVCEKLPSAYKARCNEVVHSKYPADVVCKALKTAEPAERTYWLTFLG